MSTSDDLARNNCFAAGIIGGALINDGFTVEVLVEYDGQLANSMVVSLPAMGHRYRVIVEQVPDER